MIKKLLSCMAVGAIVLTSCSSEEPLGSGEGGNVHFTASLPAELMTRSVYDDGLTATQLTYAVYDEAGNNLEALNPATPILMENKTGRVDLNLVTGKTYTVVFWAQSPDASYYNFDPKTGKMTVTPTGNSNDLGRDAFFAYETFTVTGAINKPIELRRPFAQINIGTNDLADFTAAGGEISKSGLKVTAPDVLNLLDGSVGESTADYVFAPADHIGAGFPVTVAEGETPYAWLTTNYVLVGAEPETLDVAWTSDNPNNGEVPFTFVPVQRNYRTNIYGALLTDPQGFNVTIEPGFAGPDHYKEIVKSAEDFVDAIANGNKIFVPEDTQLDLSKATEEELTSDEPIYIEIAPGSSVNLGRNHITANNGLTLVGTPETGTRTTISNGILSNEGEELGIGYHKSLIHVYGGELIIDNMTLINDPNHHSHGNTYNSSAISYWNDAKITIRNSKIISGEFTLCGMGRGGVNQAELTLIDSYFESTSSSIYNGKYWSYAMRLFGKTCYIENCEVKGIQGGVSPDEGIVCTINGGKYHVENTPGKHDSFNPVYVSASATVIIEDGEFYGANNNYVACEGPVSIVSGDNDANRPSGNVIIKKGKFSGKAYNTSFKTVYQPEDWVKLEDDAPYNWAIGY